jgi:ankyrin repeat protein
MAPFGLPALTMAFNIVGWIWCLAGPSSTSLISVDLLQITVPENHIKRILLVQNMTLEFKELKNLYNLFEIKHPQDLDYLEKAFTSVLLCLYASVGDINSIIKLVELGVDLNSQDYDNRTALHLAAAFNQLKVLEFLCSRKVNLLHDFRGETAFNDAIRSKNIQIIKILKTY